MRRCLSPSLRFFSGPPPGLACYAGVTREIPKPVPDFCSNNPINRPLPLVGEMNLLQHGLYLLNHGPRLETLDLSRLGERRKQRDHAHG